MEAEPISPTEAPEVLPDGHLSPEAEQRLAQNRDLANEAARSRIAKREALRRVAELETENRHLRQLCEFVSATRTISEWARVLAEKEESYK